MFSRTNLRSGGDEVSPTDKVRGFIDICPGPRSEADIAVNCGVTRGQVRTAAAGMRAGDERARRAVARVLPNAGGTV